MSLAKGTPESTAGLMIPLGRGDLPPVGVGTPEFLVTVRVAPAAKLRLALLHERAPKLPPAVAVERDERGWARLGRRFERTPTDRARNRLPFGSKTEVLDAPELMAETVTGLDALEDPLPLRLPGSSERPLGHKMEIERDGSAQDRLPGNGGGCAQSGSRPMSKAARGRRG